MESLRGRVQAVLHESEGFNVLLMTVYSTEPPMGVKVTKVVGPLHGLAQIKAGVTLELHGHWVDHCKYGQQFRIVTWQPWAHTPDDIGHFLSRCVRGMHDPQITQAVTDVWGRDAFTRLAEDDPLDNTRLSVARDCWKATIAFRDIASLLRDDGLSGSLVTAILQAFGHEAREALYTDPYRLMEIAGMVFSTADRMGLRLSIPPQDPRRVAGALLAALREAVRSGHLYLPRGDLASWARHYVSAIESVDESINMLVDRKALTIESGTGAYLPEWHHYEHASAQWLASNLHESPLGVGAEEFIQTYEQASHIILSDDQRQALRLLSSNRVVVLTGLPGTGKTTVVRAFVRMFEAAKVAFRLMAPTGIAAKRLASVTERPASTIHRALRYDGMSWFHNERNRLVIDAVIVDEMSMVDQELLYRLLSSLRPDTIVVFVGDDAQLPSVGPGNVLRELVRCPALPKVRLTTIFRQSNKGDIVLNAHRVNRGEDLPLHEKNPKSEFQFVSMGNQDDIAQLVVEMAAKLKGRNANFQVLSPMYDGVVGVNRLNQCMRDRLNPLQGQAEFKRKDLHFRVGDRLMVIQNDYKLAVYNGDVGKLVYIGPDELVVRIHGTGNEPDAEVRFPVDQAGKLRLAYAVTVHKCQGSEFDTIIMPLVCTQGRMLQRNLFYTAITRARKRVWILGDSMAVSRAIQNDQVQDRNTRLAECVAKCVSPV